MKRYFGAHVTSAGGLHNSLEAAKHLGANTIQSHPSPPQKWNSKRLAAGVEENINAERKSSGVEEMFFHGVYLINLANPEYRKVHF